MKKNLFLSALLLPIMLCFVACSKDDNDISDDLMDLSAIAGAYNGYTVSSCLYFSNLLVNDETVTVSNNGDGTVAVSFSSGTWGELSIGAAAVTVSSGTYTLSGTGTASMSDHSGGTTDYECELSGTIVSADDVEITFSIPAVMGGTNVVFTTGDAPAELLLPGDYTGDMSFVCQYTSMSFVEQTATITADDNGVLRVTCTVSSYGSATIEGLDVTVEDGVYTLKGEGTANIGMGSSTSDYACTLTATINKTLDEWEFVVKVPSVMGGTTVTLTPSE